MVNALSANPTKWWNTVKQIVGNSRRIVWVCLTILWGLALKGLISENLVAFASQNLVWVSVPILGLINVCLLDTAPLILLKMCLF